jgi:hypothetical protein
MRVLASRVSVALGFVCVLLVEGEAFAAEPSRLVEPGIVISVPLVHHRGFAIGPNLSYVFWNEHNALGYGGYARLELGAAHVADGDWSFLLRPAIGGQASLALIGAEVGPSLASGGGGDARLGLDVTPFVSIVAFWAGFRFTFPGTAPSEAMDGDLMFGLQAPILVGGPSPFSSAFGSGRPCRVTERAEYPEALGHDDAALACVEVGSRAWCANVAPSLEGLDDAERTRHAEAWLREALAEHASIAAFSALALDLLSLGAPPHLVAACQRAALDEIEHARLCFGVASAYAGQPLGPGGFPDAARLRQEQPTFASVAAESLLDGCQGEGAAAERARRSAASTADPVLRAVWLQIASDEANHARLGREIAEWCASEATESFAPRNAS